MFDAEPCTDFGVGETYFICHLLLQITKANGKGSDSITVRQPLSCDYEGSKMDCKKLIAIYTYHDEDNKKVI